MPIAIREVVAEPTAAVLLTVAAPRSTPPAPTGSRCASPPVAMTVRPAPWALLLTVVMSAALINNFVFTRYLGLCIFFGVSKKRDTAIGMGITFTAVMIVHRR